MVMSISGNGCDRRPVRKPVTPRGSFMAASPAWLGQFVAASVLPVRGVAEQLILHHANRHGHLVVIHRMRLGQLEELAGCLADEFPAIRCFGCEAAGPHSHPIGRRLLVPWSPVLLVFVLCCQRIRPCQDGRGSDGRVKCFAAREKGHWLVLQKTGSIEATWCASNAASR